MENSHENPSAKPQQARRRKKKKSGCAGTLLYLIVIFGVSVILSMILLFSANDILAFVKENRSVTLSVSEPTTVSAMSHELDEQGIVQYGTLFSLFVKVTGKDGEVAPGEYALNPSMDYGAIARALVKGTSGNSTTVLVTIPEGYTCAQIYQEMLDKGVASKEELDAAFNTYPFKWDFLKGMTPGENWLEGYLFPDTYEFFRGDAVQAVNKMLNNFADKYDVNVTEGAQKQGRSMHEIVTIASMVEREAQKDDEFPKIAGVIYNRIKSDMPLQIDATIQYAVGHKEELTKADLEIDSPYNTYKNKGLPPGPIASPGYTALNAATHPESHGYYYYVAMPDGSHLFAKTLSEHNQNIQTAKAAFAEAKK